MTDGDTPTWDVAFSDVPETPEEEKYGGGLDFEGDEQNDRDDAALNLPAEEPAWGPERHPRLVLSGQKNGARYHQELVSFDIEQGGCGCGGQFLVTGQVGEFPPDWDTLRLSVFGVRGGDADRLSVEVLEADPLTLTVNEESGCLYRLWATGCLVCRRGGE